MRDSQLVLTQHAKQRLQERHDQHLIRYTSEREFNIACYELLDLATYTNRHINDAKFMLFYYEKYGYDSVYRFKEYKNVLFIIVGDSVVTVIDTDEHRTTRQHGRAKRY